MSQVLLTKIYVFATPEIEGTIEVRCRNGVQKQLGYVTRHMDTKDQGLRNEALC